MLEHYVKKTGLVVQKKVKRKTKPKKKKRAVEKSQPTRVEIPAWEELRAQLAVVLGAGVDECPPPFDAASDQSIDQQKETCMKNIQKLMREYKFENAVGMLRAAREVWPEEGIFGASDIQQDEELDMLETIYGTDLGVEIPEVIEENNEDNSDDEEDEEEEEERSAAIVESDFDFNDFVQRFCSPKVVSACAALLDGYEKNLPHTNHCIVKMLHRIAWDCKRPAMMFQASLFLVFQKILNNPMPHFKELEKFAIFILRKFTEVARKNPKVFIELLFWTNSKDAIDIECGYDLYSDQKDKIGKGTWSEEQEEELRNLYMENQSNPQTDQDVIDWILENLIDQTRTRRSVIKKLKELGLIFRAPTKRSNKEGRREKVPKEFSEEEDHMLRQLWEEFSDSTDPMLLIMGRMPRKRPKRSFVERLLELGVIEDKKQCRRKRQKGTKSNGEVKDDDDNDRSSDSSSESSAQSDSDDDGSRPSSPTRVTKLVTPKRAVKKTVKAEKASSKKPAKKAPVQLSANEIAKVLVSAVDEDLTDPLKWVAESLEEVALDQEAEGFDPTAEGVPLLPLSSECVDAMENELFKKVLMGIGIMPPSDEQEAYWRIPSSLHFETIRKRREIIIKAVNKELIINSTEETVENNSNYEVADEDSKAGESSDDVDLFANLRKMRNNVENESASNTDVNKMRQNQDQTVKSANVDANRKKRSRSVDSDESNIRGKLQRIEEENGGDDEDLLSFAKKTLQTELPDTEDFLSDLPKADSDDSEDEEQIAFPTNRDKKRRRVIIYDDSE